MANKDTVISNLAEVAKTLLESDAKYDQDICKMTILFPLLETLGYDATKVGDIVLNPAYLYDGSYKLDYGLRGDGDDIIKTMIKMIDFDAEPGLEFSNIRQCLVPGSMVEYIMITDCFNYYVYANAEEGMTFIDVVSFNIASMKPNDERAFGVLKNPNVNMRQDYALNDEDEEQEEEAIIPRSVSADVKYSKQPPEKVKKEKAQLKIFSGTLYPIVIGSICAIILVTAVFLGLLERNDIENWLKIPFEYENVDITYYTIKGTVEISTYDDRTDIIHISLKNSNLPPNANVTFTLKGETSDQRVIVNALTGADGGIEKDVSVEPGWKNSSISVTATLVFDTYQTEAATSKYGQFGQYLVSIEGEKTLIGNDSVYFDFDTIDAFIKEQEANRVAAEIQAIKDYFSNYTIVKYSNGDMAFYPKGYSTDDWDKKNNNITDTNKSYAKILYDADTGTATFYYIVGTYLPAAQMLANDILLSDSKTSFTLDGHQGHFQLHVNSYGGVTGWYRFDPKGVDKLIPSLTQIYSSAYSTIEFKNVHRVEISDDDKSAVLGIINLYNKYFTNGRINIDPSIIP